VEGRTYRAALHLALDPFLGTLWLAALLPLLLVGAVSSLVLVGVPVVAAALLLARVGADLERRRARALLGLRLATPPPHPPVEGPWRRLEAVLRDREAWRAVAYLLMLCPLGVLGFSAAGLWVSGVFGAVVYPLSYWRGLGGAALELGSLRLTTGPQVALVAACGVVLMVAGPWLVRGAARLDRGALHGLLGLPPALLAERVRALEASRAQALDQAAAERRRIERDLHDGVQARLVALAMDLGIARRKVESGTPPSVAAALIASAHEEAKRALDDLRDLARGIHPAVLTSRGLDAALSSLVARSPIPVEVDVRLPGRLPPATESIAYFVVAEALANVAKHSEARRASVTVRRRGEAVLVRVSDDGVGGAAPARGGGLAGLVERLQAVDGTLRVSSPLGGPTVVLAELPCES